MPGATKTPMRKLKENRDNEIYAKNLQTPDTKKQVCKLQKKLYELKISPKRWNLRFSEEERKLGFETEQD